MRRFVLVASLAIACTPEIPEGHATCSGPTDCPATWVCRTSDHHCWRTDDGVDAGHVVDGGSDGGGADSSVDAGGDGGVDAAGDAGRDAGRDSSMDAGPTDVGTDAACVPVDHDADGYRTACAGLDASAPVDCDDGASMVHPGATEICNGIDDDCDGHIDDADPDLACAWARCDDTECDVPEEVAAGLQHTCVRTHAGHVWCWGANDRGQIGVMLPDAMTPRPVHVLSGAIDIAAGSSHSCIADSVGVQCWGLAAQGQVGVPIGTVQQNTPMPVAGAEGATSVTAGDFHTCATLPGTTRGLSCWGNNTVGELGDGTLMSRSTVAPVLPVGTSRPAFAGAHHTCYQSGSAIHCWGANDMGQLGNGTMAMQTTTGPTVPGIADGHEVRPGASFTCVYRGATTPPGYYCWGANESGQLGDGSLVRRTSPVAVNATMLIAGSVAAHYIAAGSSHTCATDASRSLWCWGANDVGQLGTGAPSSVHATPQHTSLSGMVSAIDAGAQHTCAIVADELYCWGANNLGQLGNGTYLANPTPLRITAR